MSGDNAPEAATGLSSRLEEAVTPFQLEGRAVRGRLVRLGSVIDDILGPHAYAEPVGRLVGEMVLLTTLIGSSLKFDGRFLCHASGGGAVSMLSTDYETGGLVRGFAKSRADKLASLLAEQPRPNAAALLGDAGLAMTIDQGADTNRYQSLVPLEGGALAAAAEHYFEQSEQVPTRVHLAVGLEQTGDAQPQWRAGGAILQRLAGDDARGEVDEDWEYGRALFDTLSDVELLDPAITGNELLLRLFHEEGVRVFPPTPLAKRCTCTREHIAQVLASFPEAEIAELKEDDSHVRVTCEYCNRDFRLTMGDVAQAGEALR